MTGNVREKTEAAIQSVISLSFVIDEWNTTNRREQYFSKHGSKPRIKSWTVGRPLLEPFSGVKLTPKLFLIFSNSIYTAAPFLTYEGQSKDLLCWYHIYHSVSHISSCWNQIKSRRNLNFRLHLQFTLQIKGQRLWLSGSRMFSRRIRGCRCCQGGDFPYLSWLVWGMFSNAEQRGKKRIVWCKNPFVTLKKATNYAKMHSLEIIIHYYSTKCYRLLTSPGL